VHVSTVHLKVHSGALRSALKAALRHDFMILFPLNQLNALYELNFIHNSDI
jgi:hypothetical protein